VVRYGVALSKGKYKIKISNKSKDSELNINGLAAMISNSTSKKLEIDKEYNIAVTKGKTYKWKFEVKEEDQYNITNLFISYDPDEILLPGGQIDGIKIVNSKGETIENSIEYYEDVKLKEGTYILIIKASMTGYHSPKIHRLTDNGYFDSLFKPDLVNGGYGF